MLKKLPKIFKNFYFLTTVFLVGWLLFVDSNDILSQFKLYQKQASLHNEKDYYLEQIELVKKEREAILNNPELLEKFARERYFMKKPTEEIFVIEEE
jgi:cell division protein DivIC